MQRTSLRFFIVASLALTACGDDKGDETGDLTTSGQATPATDMSASSGDPGTTGTGSTTDTPTTDDSTTGPVVTTSTTADDTTGPTSTTDDDTTGSTTADESSTGPDTTTMGGLSFAADVFPVWNPPVRCDCHVGGAGGLKMGGTAAEAYAVLVDVKANGAALDRVEPGDAGASYVLNKLLGTQADVGGGGSKMPLGAPPFSQTDIDLIAQWIDEGASP